jgi:hypothetical protein
MFPEPVLPPEEQAMRPATRLNLARQAAAARVNQTSSEQINLLQLVHKAALAVKAAYLPNPPSPINEQLGEHVEGPTFLADENRLPPKMPAKTTTVGNF